MNDDDLKRMMGGDQITPSSGFAAGVMEEVLREASTPPPIPFPWSRAIPGFLALAAAMGLFFTAGFSQLQTNSGKMAALFAGTLQSAHAANADWMTLAVVLSAVTLWFSMRLVRR